MKAGDLVKTTRAQVGVPLGSIGLIIKSHDRRQNKHSIHEVHIYGVKLGTNRRFLSRDLETVNESR